MDGAPDGRLTIGELAARAGVGADVIRYYERVGVLPRPARGAPGATHGGYRLYTGADVARLAFVRRARTLGFSLGEVRELLALAGEPGRPCGDVDRLARAHLAQVEAKLAELTALRAELARLVGACGGGRAVADCDILCRLGAESAVDRANSLK